MFNYYIMSVIKSPNDNNEYSTFKMSNKLNVFIEHNKNIQNSCVMAIVNIGYMMDKFSGMAHFLEHMLFNGTQKYPDEKYFSNYVTKYGGRTNAFTTHDNTCYYYTIATEELNNSLDAFSQFFISPLLKKDTVAREREAVNSEHEKNILDDGWRFSNVLKTACNKNNPFSNFCTGSNKTLDVPDIDKEIRIFFDTYYSSDVITLIVITNEEIDSVKNVIQNTFDKITLKPKSTTKLKNNKNLPILNSPKSIYLIPVADINKLTIHWDISSNCNQCSTDPINFISFLIGHEGKGTLHNCLTNLGYILGMYCGSYERVNDRCIFIIDVTLSESGLESKNIIIDMIFKYIDCVKHAFVTNDNKLVELYKEQCKLQLHSFKFSEQIDPVDKCMLYYENIARYKFPLKYLLIINYIKDDYVNIKNNALEILNVLNNKCVVIYTSKKYSNIATTIDEHYGTKYKITNEILSVSKLNNSEIISLPLENSYVSFGSKIIMDTLDKPIILNSHYYHPINKFGNPDVNINMNIYLPLSTLNAYEYTKILVYIASIMLNINSEKYMCTSANYYLDVTFDMGNLEIEIHGNYLQINKVCKLLSTNLIHPQFTEDDFKRTVYSFQQNDNNLIFEAPYSRITNFFNKNVLLKYYDNYDRLKEYPKLKYLDVKNISNSLLNLGTFDLLISGNVDVKLYNEIVNSVSILKPKVMFNKNTITSELGVLTLKENVIIKKENDKEKNNAIGYYIFINKVTDIITQLKNICLLEMLFRLISQEYFYQLRTQEKFGYIVGSNICSVGNHNCEYKYYRFVVQSQKKSTDEMIKRTEIFITTFKKNILNLSQKDFDDIKDSCINLQEEEVTNLYEQSAEKFNELKYDLHTFDLRKRMISMYHSLTLQDINKFYDQKFINRIKTIISIST
jgi:insulysin